MKQTVRVAIYGCVAFLLIAAVAIAWHKRERSRLFYTTADTVRVPRDTASIRDVLWQPAIELAPWINTSEDEYEPQLTLDGGTLIFVRGQAALNADLYSSTRTQDGWSEPAPMEGVNSPADELGPETAPGGRALYFSSNRAGGWGGYDLWVVHRTEEGWGEPVNLGPGVNSRDNEFAPSLAPEGTTLYFSSNRPIVEEDDGSATRAPPSARQKKRDYNIFVASVTHERVDRARSAGEINSPYDDWAPSVSPLGDFIYFSSNRPGGYGGFDIYRARRQMGVPTTVTRLGATVNSPLDELDPSASFGGFVLHFSSNRAPADDETATANQYDLYYAMSREVFAETETYREALGLAELARTIGPLLAYLLLAALLLLGMMKIDTKHRKLTLLARCMLGSMLVHVLVLICLSAWQVSTALIGAPKRGGGTQVVLSSPPSSADLASQMRGELVQVQPADPAAAAAAARRQTTVTELPQAANNTFAVERAAMEAPDQPSEVIEARDAAPAPVQEITRRTDAQLAQATATSVALPQQPTPVEVTESIAGVPRVEAEGVRFDPEASAALPVRPSLGDPSVAVTPSTVDLDRHDASQRQLVQRRPASEVVLTPPALDGTAATVAAADTSSIAQLSLPADAAASVTAVEASPPLEARRPGAVRRDHTPGSQAAPIDARTIEINPSTIESSLGSASLALAGDVEDRGTTPPDAPRQPSVHTAVNAARGPSLRIPGTADSRAETRVEERPTPELAGAEATLATRSSVRFQDAFDAAVDMQPVLAETVVDSASMITSLAAVTDPAEPMQPPITDHLGARELAPVSLGIPRRFEEPSTAQAAPEAARHPELMTADTRRAALPPVVTGDGAPVAGGAIVPPAALVDPIVRQDSFLETVSLDVDLDALFDTIEDTPVAIQPIGEHRPRTLALSLPSPATTPQMQYHQRSEETRRERLDEMGGSEETEEAVTLALGWLARHQSPDGRWDSNNYDAVCGHCPGAATMDVDVALTSLSLLAYLAAGHAPATEGPYRDTVDRGLTWLLAQQGDHGSLLGEESMYSHAMATMALAEAYGMSEDEKFAQPVKAATDFIYAARNQTFGGWRYKPGQIGDTSVLGWQVMALMSAKRSGVAIEENALDVARRWLPEVADPLNPGLYAYQPAQNATPAMTAESMFIMELLGFDRDAKMQASADYILRSPPRWQRNTSYYWYYATLALFQYGGDEWARWNGRIKEVLLAHQSTEGETAGSWPPADKWGKTGGRVYQTAICTLTLEVYYRYLPLYARDMAWVRDPSGVIPAR